MTGIPYRDTWTVFRYGNTSWIWSLPFPSVRSYTLTPLKSGKWLTESLVKHHNLLGVLSPNVSQGPDANKYGLQNSYLTQSERSLYFFFYLPS